MEKKLKELYQTVILAHNALPFHFEKKTESEYILEAYNPLCGDKFQLFLEVKEGIVRNVFFHGYGCAISKAATSVLAKNIENLTLEKALELCQSFLKMVDPTAEEMVEMTEEFTAFAAVKNFPARLKCVTLSWEEVLKFLQSTQ